MLHWIHSRGSLAPLKYRLRRLRPNFAANARRSSSRRSDGTKTVQAFAALLSLDFDAVDDDGTFKSHEELEQIYLDEAGLKRDDETIIAYCRIGERSSHTWFVLKYLLGFDNVKNYDGSWTEWGNLVGVPIEKNV